MTMPPASLLTPARLRLLAGIALLLLASKWLLLALYPCPVPYFDQWTAEGMQTFLPWLRGQMTAQVWLGAFNEHRIASTRLLDITLLTLNHGIWNVTLQNAVNAVLATAVLVYLVYLLGKACPPRRWPLFVLAAALLLAVPGGWENLLLSFMTQMYLVIFCGLLSVRYLTADTPLSRSWWLGFFWGLLGFLSMAPAIITLGLGALLTAAYLRDDRQRGRALIGAALLLLVAALCYRLTPVPDTVVRQGYQHATVVERLAALNWVLSWPLLAGASLIVQLPFFCFALRRLRRPPDKSADWLLLGIGLWVLAQCAGIAWARSTMPVVSRYIDIIALGLPVNLLCLLRYLDMAGKRRLAEWSVALWAIVVVAGLVVQAANSRDAMQQRSADSAKQQRWIQAYLAAGTEQQQAMARDLPGTGYPDPASPVVFLAEPKLVSTLPNITPAVTARQAGWVLWLLAHLHVLVLLLLASGTGLVVLAWRRALSHQTDGPDSKGS
jgi:hypothetical protein